MEDGIYELKLSFHYQALADGIIVAARIGLNGTTVCGNTQTTGSTANQTAFVSCILDLSDGDYLEAFTFHTHGSARNVLGGAGGEVRTFFSLVKYE